MGCHTLFYERVKNVPSDDIMLKYYKRVTYETIKSDGTKQKDGYYDLKFDLYKSWIKITNYRKRPEMTSEILDINKVPEEIRHLFTPEDLFFDEPNYNSSLVFDEKGLYKELTFGDLFRISSYPDVRIHSYKEAEEFIMSDKVVEYLPEGYDEFEGDYEDDPDKVLYTLSYRSKGQTKKSVLDIIKKFFDEHPEGLILFG